MFRFNIEIFLVRFQMFFFYNYAIYINNLNVRHIRINVGKIIFDEYFIQVFLIHKPHDIHYLVILYIF